MRKSVTMVVGGVLAMLVGALLVSRDGLAERVCEFCCHGGYEADLL